MANGIIGKVTAGGGTHLVTSTFYGTCATAAGTAAKIVKLADATADAATAMVGMTLAVKFTYSNTATNPTLTVQRNGNTTNLIAATSIKSYGTTAPGTTAATSWRAGAVVLFVYVADGNNYYWTQASSLDYDTTYTFDGDYNAFGNKAATVSTVNNAKIQKLSVTISSTSTDESNEIYPYKYEVNLVGVSADDWVDASGITDQNWSIESATNKIILHFSRDIISTISIIIYWAKCAELNVHYSTITFSYNNSSLPQEVMNTLPSPVTYACSNGGYIYGSDLPIPSPRSITIGDTSYYFDTWWEPGWGGAITNDSTISLNNDIEIEGSWTEETVNEG